MPPQSQEIELKFLCAPEDLGRILAAAPEGSDDTRELISVYFDTPERDLERAGASLRVRESKGQRVQTLKRGDGLAREEHEATIAGDAPDPSLGPLPDLLPQTARDQLKPAFHVRVTRRQRLVRFDGADIELALDQGEVRGGARASPISEVELELKSGEPPALYGLARLLAHAAPIYLSFATKSQRGQALVSGDETGAANVRPALSADATVAEAFQATARGSLAGIAQAAEGLRAAPDPEGVHRLRVATRTLRSALSTFAQAVQDEAFEHVKAELRWLGKACDQVRNLDVFAEQTLARAGELPVEPRGLAALSAAVDAGREAARRQAVEAVASARFRDLLIDVTAWVDTGSWRRSETAGAPARAFAADRLSRRLKRLTKDGRRLAHVSDEQRHQVRIDAKKLRYAAEGFQDLFGRKRAKGFISHLKAFQDELGALNDLATAEPLMAQLELSPDAAFAAGELIGMKAAAKGERLDAASRALKRLLREQPFWA